MALDPEQNAANNFSGLPFEAALEWAKKMPEHSTLSFSGPLTHPGYKDVPVTYIFTEQDRTVPPAMQRAQIATIEEARGGKVEVLPIPTDHFPYVTATEEMAGALRKVLAAL
ncbi:MAG: hypothetical protein INR71_09730 [Terriglobus roseus]|nr:hypothetical protein [Terriglobus roseus]